MNPEIKERWVAALRSGEYKQGRNYLTRVTEESTRYCCLGVLCDIAAKEGVVEVVTRDGDDEETIVVYDSSEAFLPERVQAWADLPYSSPVVAWDTLVGLNDGEGWTFQQIADAIEQHL